MRPHPIAESLYKQIRAKFETNHLHGPRTSILGPFQTQFAGIQEKIFWNKIKKHVVRLRHVLRKKNFTKKEQTVQNPVFLNSILKNRVREIGSKTAAKAMKYKLLKILLLEINLYSIKFIEYKKMLYFSALKNLLNYLIVFLVF